METCEEKMKKIEMKANTSRDCELKTTGRRVGTTVIAFKAPNGLYLAYDGCATDVSPDGTEKIGFCGDEYFKYEQLSDSIYILNAGDWDMLFPVREELAEYVKNTDKKCSVSDAMFQCVQIMKGEDFKKDFYKYEGGFLIAGFEGGKPTIGVINLEEGQLKHRMVKLYKALGTGLDFANDVLDKFKPQPDTEAKEYIDQIKKALVVAAKKDKYSGVLFEIKYVNAAGTCTSVYRKDEGSAGTEVARVEKDRQIQAREMEKRGRREEDPKYVEERKKRRREKKG